MSDRVYCYQGSNIMINKFNIRDLNRLNEADRKLTQLRLNDLIISPIKGNFDLSHLQKIHQFLFQDLYTWAARILIICFSLLSQSV